LRPTMEKWVGAPKERTARTTQTAGVQKEQNIPPVKALIQLAVGCRWEKLIDPKELTQVLKKEQP